MRRGVGEGDVDGAGGVEGRGGLVRLQAVVGVVGRVEDEDAEEQKGQGLVRVEGVVGFDVGQDLGLEGLEEGGGVEARDGEGLVVDFWGGFAVWVVGRFEGNDAVGGPLLEVGHGQLVEG